MLSLSEVLDVVLLLLQAAAANKPAPMRSVEKYFMMINN
jgi:hypothetical protein